MHASNENKTFYINLLKYYRPSSDIMLVPYQTEVNFGLSHGRKTTLIQTPCQSQTKFRIYWCPVTVLLLTSSGNVILPKHSNIICEFCLARQMHYVWITAVQESCSTAEFVKLKRLSNLMQKFDSDAVLLLCCCCTLFLNLVWHSRGTTSELDLSPENYCILLL